MKEVIEEVLKEFDFKPKRLITVRIKYRIFILSPSLLYQKFLVEMYCFRIFCTHIRKWYIFYNYFLIENVLMTNSRTR